MAPTLVPDRLDDAIARVEAAPVEPETFVFNVRMGEGRRATLTLPVDITDREFLQLLGIITGPGRVELAGLRAKAEGTTTPSGLQLPDRSILRPI